MRISQEEDLDGMGGGKELGRLKGQETLIRIYCTRKICLLNIGEIRNLS